MSFDPRQMAAAGGGVRRPSPARLIRRVIVIGFGVVQLILAARIAHDLGYLPSAIPADLVIRWSDAVAAPVKGIAGSFLGNGGGVGFGGITGANPTIVAALAGWSVVEGVVWQVLGRFL